MVASFLKRYWFLLGILAALLFGLLLPRGGELLNPSGISTNLVIVALFIILGYTLPTESIAGGMRDVSLHFYIQGFIFLFTPLYFYLTSLLFRGFLAENLLIGIYALSCLPTTISSCIVLTQISGGNVVGSIVNASVANMLGIVLSPLILSLLIYESNLRFSTAEILGTLRSLGLKMLLPIIGGQILRLFGKALAQRLKKKLGLLSNFLILTIIYFAVAGTAGNPYFNNRILDMLLPFGYLALSQVLLVLIAYGGTRLLRFRWENTVSVVYTAPQKTMAMGVPLLTTIFAERPQVLGLALLPLLFYHPWQLLVAAFLKESPLIKKRS
jgi:sodium/bile acid cotransporter 7